MMTVRMKVKVLVSAYACEPDKGSEPGVGWNWAKQIARFHEAWVITRPNNRVSIEKALAAAPDPNLHFIYVDPPRWLTCWKKKQRGVRTYYYLWQIAAYLKTKSLIETHRFDIAHHVTFVNDWLPSFLAFTGVPFIWGPIGSNLPIPTAFLPNRKAVVRERLRLVIQFLMRSCDPFYRWTVMRASRIIMLSPQLRGFPFTRRPIERFNFEPAIGINITEISTEFHAQEHSDLRVISVGNFIPIKNFHITIRAFAEAQHKNQNMKLELIGEGPERARLSRLTETLALATSIKFRGALTRSDVLKELSRADIFIFPSFEGGGMVVLEAMAAGLPVICLDYGGPDQMVTEECGIKVKPVTPEQTVSDLAKAILTLAQDLELRQQMGVAGRRRAQKVYNWDRKGELIQRIYNEVFADENTSRS